MELTTEMAYCSTAIVPDSEGELGPVKELGHPGDGKILMIFVVGKVLMIFVVGKP